MPAVERILKIFAPMRPYFLSLEKCPKVLETFFNTDSSELWLKFVHSQASIFYNAVKQIEGEHITVFETFEQIHSIRQNFDERIKENYLPLLSQSDLTKLVEMGSLTKEWFMSHLTIFTLIVCK
jgi:UDP-N-acetylmuramate-alanine ligase